MLPFLNQLLMPQMQWMVSLRQPLDWLSRLQQRWPLAWLRMRPACKLPPVRQAASRPQSLAALSWPREPPLASRQLQRGSLLHRQAALQL